MKSQLLKLLAEIMYDLSVKIEMGRAGYKNISLMF